MSLSKAVAVVLGLLLAAPAVAQTPEEFFRGKTVRMLVGTAAGGPYDIAGRVVSMHIRKYLPGNPNIVIENLPGAGAVIMTNRLYNQMPRDGTAIGIPISGVLLEPLLHLFADAGGSVQYDLKRLSWVGTPSQEPTLLWIRPGAGIGTFEDLKTKKVVIGATGAGTDQHLIPTMMKSVFNLPLTVVKGYHTPQDIFLAAERGEVDGIVTGFSAFAAFRPNHLQEINANVHMQFGAKRIPALANVPTALEKADEDGRTIFGIFATKYTSARPFMLPPDVPADRVKAWRDAFDETVKDPQFLADAKKVSLDIDPVSGLQITALIDKLIATPPAVAQRIRALAQE